MSTGKESVAMSIFPTRILLAPDGSQEAELSTLRAVEFADATDSEFTWCTSEWYPFSCRAIQGLWATMASSTSR